MEVKRTVFGRITDIIVPVIAILGFLCEMYRLILSIGYGTDIYIGICVINIIAYVAVLFYALYGYRTPHGNMLRYTIIIFAFTLVLGVNEQFRDPISYVQLLLESLCVVPVAFTAGRLHKIKQNRALFIICFIAFIVSGILTISGINSLVEIGLIEEITGIGKLIMYVTSFNKAIMLIAIVKAYELRYKLHQEAGFEEDKKSQEENK